VTQDRTIFIVIGCSPVKEIKGKRKEAIPGKVFGKSLYHII
jgi:hypothetical protein